MNLRKKISSFVRQGCGSVLTGKSVGSPRGETSAPTIAPCESNRFKDPDAVGAIIDATAELHRSCEQLLAGVETAETPVVKHALAEKGIVGLGQVLITLEGDGRTYEAAVVRKCISKLKAIQALYPPNASSLRTKTTK